MWTFHGALLWLVREILTSFYGTSMPKALWAISLGGAAALQLAPTLAQPPMVRKTGSLQSVTMVAPPHAVVSTRRAFAAGFIVAFSHTRPSFAEKEPAPAFEPLPTAIARAVAGDTVKAAEDRAAADKKKAARAEDGKEARAERLAAAKAEREKAKAELREKRGMS